MLENKPIIYLLIVYVLFQLGGLFFQSAIMLIIYVVAYFIAICYSSIKIYVSLKQLSVFNTLTKFVPLFFIANVILFLVYLPVLVYNPEINWKLKGGTEQDPMLLEAYVPPVFFIIALLAIMLTVIITKIVLHYNNTKVLK